MQQVAYLEMDYDSFVVLCNSIEIVAQTMKPFIIYLLIMQPIQFFAPEIKKWIKEKSVKKKPFRGLQ